MTHPPADRSHPVARILAEVRQIAQTLHQAGTFSATALDALVRHGLATPVAHSVETGSGASTLLLSHLSSDHTVFAMDGGTGSIRAIENSPLLRRDVVRFVEGPTQLTLPRHRFTSRLQLALIDGPHGYPFPDLEYYFLYQHLDAGALLVIDDIHIPTITNLFDFLSADEMFDLQEVVENTAFFRRTAAPTFDPTGDDWDRQRYNQRAFVSTPAELVIGAAPAISDQPVAFHLDQLGPIADPAAAGALVVPQGQPLALRGWALDTVRQTPAAAVDAVLRGAAYRTLVRVPRGDVADAHGSRAYLRSGFSTELPKELVTSGRHQLELRIVLAGARECVPVARLEFVAA